MKYAQIIEELENAIKEIETKGISIKPLNKAIDDLKSHSQNIEAVEKNIDAIKKEVIKPIKTELEENKRAGKFSIWGFYIGAFALVVTTISLVYTTFFSFSNLELKDNNIVNGNYIPTKSEIKLVRYESVKLLKSGNNNFSIEAHYVTEEETKGKWYPLVNLKFSINNKNLGLKGIEENVKIINNSGISQYNPTFNSIELTENDGFIINGSKYQIERIFRKSSKILTICDDIDGVLIKKIE